MVYPIVPLFLTATLGAPVVTVGVIEGIAESTASILKLFSGWFSDRVGKRVPFTLFGYTLAALSKLGLAAAVAWPFVLVARFVDRAGKGIRTAPRDALIAASTDEANRGRAFGLHRALDTLGAVAGPLIAIALLHFVGASYRLIFLLAFIPGVAGALLVFTVKDVVMPKRQGPPPLLLSLRGYDRRFLQFLAITLLFAVGNSSDAFLILRARDLGLGTTAAIFAYVLYNVSYAGLSLPAGIRSDKVGRKRVLVAGFAIFAGVYAGFAFAGGSWAVWPLFVIYGAYIAFTDGVGKAYVSDLVPEERRATAIGLYNATSGVMILFASLIGGALWDLVGPAATFTLGASTAGAAALALIVAPGLPVDTRRKD